MSAQHQPQLVSSAQGTYEEGPHWGRRIAYAGVLLLALIVAGLIASFTVPRWWAQRVGDQVNGSITQGMLVGLFYGFVFTLLPILVVTLVLLWRRKWRAVIIALLVAVILAVPNLMTLGIVLGTGEAAHAAERTLDVEAPAFRNFSLIGAIAAVAVALFVGYLVFSRRAARAKAHRAQIRLDEASVAQAAPPVADTAPRAGAADAAPRE